MKHLLMLLPVFVLIACANNQCRPTAAASDSQRQPSADLNPPPGQQPNGTLTKDSPHTRTVWTLQQMAREGRFDKLNYLFNHGMEINHLPVGMAAGTGTRVLNASGGVGELLDDLVGENWRGKNFERSGNHHQSTGLNRILAGFPFPNQMDHMAHFDTYLEAHNQFAPQATTKVVILSYAHPGTGQPNQSGYLDNRTWQEQLLSTFQVFDVIVPVQGKYGPVYIGRAFLGRYDQNNPDPKTKFTTQDPNTPVAWFFLDFNKGALHEQKTEHWPGSPWDGN